MFSFQFEGIIHESRTCQMKQNQLYINDFPNIPAEICLRTSVNKSFDLLADKDQTRVKSLIHWQIEQVTLYKTQYTAIRPNQAGICYQERKFDSVQSTVRHYFSDLSYLILIWFVRAEHGLSEYIQIIFFRTENKGEKVVRLNSSVEFQHILC